MGLRADQLAQLAAESDDDGGGDEVMGGAGHVVDRAEHDHVGGVSQTGALAGNFAAAAALRARLKGERNVAESLLKSAKCNVTFLDPFVPTCVCSMASTFGAV